MRKNLAVLFSVIATIFYSSVLSANPLYQYSPNYYVYPQSGSNIQNRGGPFNVWKNWFQHQVQNGNWQQGEGNIFQDAKGFYKLMGNGKTKWKFYFDVDFQTEMDAWFKSQNRAKAQNRQNHNYQNHYQHHQRSQLIPNYYYSGQGYYQGYGYPAYGYPVYPGYRSQN